MFPHDGNADVQHLLKPQSEDVAALPSGSILWGWPHCVQDSGLTQTAIENRLTLIAFEAMNHWTPRGDFNLHVFHKNNELAGCCSVLHALGLIGSTGDYGPRQRCRHRFRGHGSRGGDCAQGAGDPDIQVLTQRGATPDRHALSPDRRVLPRLQTWLALRMHRPWIVADPDLFTKVVRQFADTGVWGPAGRHP